MMRTLFALQDIDPGLNTGNVLLGRFAFPQDQRADGAGRSVFLERVVHDLHALPGVVAVSPSFGYPLEGGPSLPVTVVGTAPTSRRMALVEFVGDEYFRVVGLPLVSGRLLSRADVGGARRVVVVNRRFAQEFLEGSDPIGRMTSLAGLDKAAGREGPSLLEIVGVVGDAKNSGLQDDVRPQVFLPYTTPGVPVAAIALRSSVDPLSLQNAVREQIWAVNPSVALTNVMSLEDVRYRDSLAEPTFGVGLLSSFAGIGLLLSAIGVFSVMAYTVSLQTHEIGIRMALGAEAASVVRMIVLRGLRPIVAGAVVGVGTSYGLSRVLANQIYGVRATDPWTIAVAVIVLVAVGLIACLLPARRATKVDPQIALRYE